MLQLASRLPAPSTGNMPVGLSKTADWAIVMSERGRGKKNIVRADEGSFHVPFEMTVTCATCPGPGS